MLRRDDKWNGMQAQVSRPGGRILFVFYTRKNLMFLPKFIVSHRISEHSPQRDRGTCNFSARVVWEYSTRKEQDT